MGSARGAGGHRGEPTITGARRRTQRRVRRSLEVRRASACGGSVRARCGHATATHSRDASEGGVPERRAAGRCRRGERAGRSSAPDARNAAAARGAAGSPPSGAERTQGEGTGHGRQLVASVHMLAGCMHAEAARGCGGFQAQPPWPSLESECDRGTSEGPGAAARDRANRPLYAGVVRGR